MEKKYFIMGRHCLDELIKVAPERILKVYLYKEIKDLKGFPYKIVSKNTLFNLVNSDSHQGCVALVKAKPMIELKPFLEKSGSLSCLLMLDSIYDPQNLGAIFRSAECFGVDAVIWSKNRGTGLTPTVSKTSSGASELIEKILVSNLVETARRCKEYGYRIVIADPSAQAQSIFSFTFPEKTLLIVGSEGKGIQPLLKKEADYHVKIPMSGKLASLNVAQATSIFLAFCPNHKNFIKKS